MGKMELPKEVRLLIDRYVSEQNALGSRYGMQVTFFPTFQMISVIRPPSLPAEMANCRIWW